MQCKHKPDLSIIVPLLSEMEELIALFDSLGSQSGTDFELILSDGGSCCQQEELALELASRSSFPVKYIRAPRGRGSQMNAAAGIAASEILLFLHADSRFTDENALSSGMDFFRKRQQVSATPLAARFALRFRRKERKPSLAYSFYEAKARLERADCIRGDQGLMITREFFFKLGRFDESLPYLEDIRLASSLSGQGQWLLLPAEISTSARRFEVEGLYERQVVNAIILNAVVTQWEELLAVIPSFYRVHAESGRLELAPVLEDVRSMLASKMIGWRSRFWFASGRHLAANAWQLFFWLDVRRAFIAGMDSNHVDQRWSIIYGRYLEPLSRTRLVICLATALIWLCFWTMLVQQRMLCRKPFC